MSLQPCAQRYILRIAQLRRGHSLAVKVFRLLDARIVSDYQSHAATSCAGEHSKRFPVGADIAGNGGIRANIGHVDGAGKQRFDSRWSGVETCPLNLRAWPQRFLKPSIRLSDHGLRVRDVRERAHADYCLAQAREYKDKNEQPHNSCASLIHLCPGSDSRGP